MLAIGPSVIQAFKYNHVKKLHCAQAYQRTIVHGFEFDEPSSIPVEILNSPNLYFTLTEFIFTYIQAVLSSYSLNGKTPGLLRLANGAIVVF